MTSSDSIKAYSYALKEIQEAEQKVNLMGKAIYQIGDALTGGPYSLVVSGQENLFPETTIIRRKATLHPSNWPSAQDIEGALLKMHAARELVTALWDRVPDSQKPNLKGPPPTRF